MFYLRARRDIYSKVYIFFRKKNSRQRERERDRKSYVVVGRVVVVHFMKIMSQASLFARDKVSSCVLYCGRRCVPRASPLEFPATHFFSYSNRAPKQRDNECTQPCRRPPAFVSALGFRVRISRKSQRGWQGRDRERERARVAL